MIKLMILRRGEYPEFLGEPSVITRVLTSKRRKGESECQGDAARNTPLAAAGSEEGAGQEPRDTGSLWKPERQVDGFSPEPPEGTRPASNLVFALHLHFRHLTSRNPR